MNRRTNLLALLAAGAVTVLAIAGFDRRDPEAPGVVPSSARPQAWAAGTPLLLLRAELGLEPDPDARVLRVTDAELPSWLEGLLLEGVPAFGRRWRVRVENGRATVEPSEEPAPA